METRVRITAALVDGNSIRATSRMTSVDKNTVMDFGLRLGFGCNRIHNRVVRDIAAYLLSADETWSFCSKKQARVTEADPAEWGDLYTFVALDSTTKLVVSYLAGKRDQATTDAFIEDLRARLSVAPHFSTDGWQPYISAVAEHFRGSIDYGMVVKQYGYAKSPDHKYEAARDARFIQKVPISGAPVKELMSTSHVERLNLTLRHTVGRTRRHCLAFSRKLENHRAAIALGIAAYNFVRVHATLGTTPAVASGLAERPWTIAELVAVAMEEPDLEAPTAKPLAPRPGAEVPARQTTTGRVLRLVHGGSAAAPVPEVTAPDAPAILGGPAQLGLFDPRPEPTKGRRPMEQLSLFDD